MVVLDQTFSTRNFSTIWNERTRKGENLKALVPGAVHFSNELNDLRKSHKALLDSAGKNREEREAVISQYLQQRNDTRTRRDQALLAQLTVYSQAILGRIESGDFSIPLLDVGIRNGKQSFTLDITSPENYFLTRQLERNIKVAFEIKHVDRHRMVSEVATLMGDSSPKTLLKADVTKFYENVPHALLLDTISSNRSVSRTTLRFVEELLVDFAALAGKPTGLPRGVGLSSFLAEAYLQGFDRKIRSAAGITYYSRYVDDIVVMQSHKSNSETSNAIRSVVRKELGGLGLKLNGSKTRLYSTSDPESFRTIRLLGYEIRIESARGIVDLDMSKNRYDRYVSRLESALAHYLKSPLSPGSQTALVGRLKFLTSNNRTLRPVGSAMTGIYFSNRAIKKSSKRMDALDSRLGQLLADPNVDNSVRLRVAKCSFTNGFRDIEIRRYRPVRLRQLKTIWVWEAANHEASDSA